MNKAASPVAPSAVGDQTFNASHVPLFSLSSSTDSAFISVETPNNDVDF